VVVAIHENTGINIWTRSVADQLAADGFIGIAPDLCRPPCRSTPSSAFAGAEAVRFSTLRIRRHSARQWCSTGPRPRPSRWQRSRHRYSACTAATTRASTRVSPNELNAHLGTFIVAPLTTGSHAYLFRVACRFAGKDGHVVLDQVRTVDHQRLVKRLGALTGATQPRILGVLQAMFAP